MEKDNEQSFCPLHIRRRKASSPYGSRAAPPTRERAGPRRARPCPGSREGAFGRGLQKIRSE